MAGLGWQELVIVLVIIMIIFGAGKLPEIAKSLGQGVKEFREEASAPVVPATTRTTGTATETTLRSDADGARMTSEDTVDAAGETVRVEEVRTAPTSRDAIESLSRRSDFVLVTEPARDNGCCVTGRRRASGCSSASGSCSSTTCRS